MLAVIGAVCLIAVAVLVRSAFAGGDGGGGGGNGSGNGDLPVVACTPDLAAVCDALVADDRIAADPQTLDLADAAAPPPEVDAWITWDPAPAIANIDADQENQPEPWSKPVALAGGVLGVLGTAQEIEAACPGGTTWRCIGEAGIDGTSTIGVGDPTTSEGLVRLGPLAFATAGDPISADTLAFGLGDIVDGPVGGQGTAAEMAIDLATRSGSVDLVVGPMALLRGTAGSAAGTTRKLVAETALNDQPVAVVVAARTEKGASLGDLCAGDSPSIEGTDTARALDALGLDELCTEVPDDSLAGLLWQVRRNVT